MKQNNKIKPIAFYLPQFHRVKENDEWWGEGFTDWVTVKKAEALYEGQNQPQIPLNGHFYDLLDIGTLRWQAQLARENDIYGFCFYHYYFKDGQKILERPAEILLDNKDIDINYCFSWANETWARTWSKIAGANDWSEKFEKKSEEDDGVLLLQEYGNENDWLKHFKYLLPFFKDDRYIKKDNCPVLIIHKPDDVICQKKMFDYWDECAIKEGFDGIYTIGRNTEKEIYTKALLYQGPAAGWNENITDEPVIWYRRDDILCGNYCDAWNNLLLIEAEKSVDCYFGGFVDYDETPRKGHKGIVADGATPHLFQKYIKELAVKNIAAGNEFLFINAWNEWGEGNHLEPDEINRYQYINAVKEAVKYIDCLSDYGQEWNNIWRNIKIEKESQLALFSFNCGSEAKDSLQQYKDCFHMMNWWKGLERKNIKLSDVLLKQNYRNIGIYGWGSIGEHFYNEVKDVCSISYVIDRIKNDPTVKIIRPDEEYPAVDVIVVSVVRNREMIMDEIKTRKGIPVISLFDLIEREYHTND